jgi:hypothetical protein
MDTIAIQRHFAHGFWPPLQQVIVAVIVFVAGAGLGAFVSVSASGGRSATRFAAGMSICASLTLILSMFMTSDSQDFVLFEQALFSTRAGLMFVGLINAISIAGWLWGLPTIRLRYLACGAASAAVAGVVPKLWDYYLMDVAVFGIVSASLTSAEGGARTARFARTVGFAAAAGLLAIQSNFIVTIKKLIDINYAAVALHERALRAGILSPTDVPDAPFGYQAWHLYPYTFIAENSRGDIRKLIRAQSSVVRWDDADIPPPTEENGRLQPGQTVIASDFFPFRWTQSQRFSLVLNPTPKDAAVSMDMSRYTFEPYPLSNAEWREYDKNFKPLDIDHERLRIEATPLPGEW